MQDTDVVDGIQKRLGELYPDLATTALGITGRVIRLGEALMARRAEHLAEFGLTCADFDVMATLRRVQGPEGVNPRRLLESVLITSGGLTKRLDRLEQAGFIERSPDPDDRRGTLIRLTDAGVEHIDRVFPSLVDMEQRQLSSELSERQLEQGASLLRRIHLSIEPPATD